MLARIQVVMLSMAVELSDLLVMVDGGCSSGRRTAYGAGEVFRCLEGRRLEEIDRAVAKVLY